MSFSVFAARNTTSFLHFFTGITSMAYFLISHTLSDELKRLYGTFLSLIIWVSHFCILGKTLPQTHLIIRECC